MNILIGIIFIVVTGGILIKQSKDISHNKVVQPYSDLNINSYIKNNSTEGLNNYNVDLNENTIEDIATDAIKSTVGEARKHGVLNEYDSYFLDAAKLIVDKDKASIGMLQRYFKIGFNRAARIMEELEAEGVVGPEIGTKPREVIMDGVELEKALDIISNRLVEENSDYDVKVKEEVTMDINIAEYENYKFPPLTILNEPTYTQISDEDIHKQIATIGKIFEEFGFLVEVYFVNVGNRFIVYSVTYEELISYKKIREINEELELNLRNEVVFELSKEKENTILFKIKKEKPDIISLKKLIKQKKNQHSLIVGSDGLNGVVEFDYTESGHLLIGGATGTGKSSMLDGIILNLIFNYSPSQVRLVLIDTSFLYLRAYNGIPHLISPVASEGKQIINILKWICNDIQKRKKQLLACGARSISNYEKIRDAEKELYSMPRIFVIIDDLSDVLSRNPQVENLLNKIVRNGRNVGIHLIVVTQRPTVSAIGEFIKSNATDRIAFGTLTSKDSQIILDKSGAEKINEKESFLYKKFVEKDVVTGYVPNIDADEIQRVVDFFAS